MTTKIVLYVSLLVFGQIAVAKVKVSDFQDKWFYTHWVSSNQKEQTEKISQCAQLKRSTKSLDKYKSCDKLKSHSVPGSIGVCKQDDGFRVYFFDSKDSCEISRKAAVDHATM